MKTVVAFLILCFIYCPSMAQLKRPAPPQKKIDSLKLSCPVTGGIMQSPSDKGVGYKGDVKVIIKNSSDSLFLAPVDGKIDLITMGEGGKNEIVMHYYNYNIWFIGISKSLVRKNDTIKKGQPIGRITPGDEVELLLFDDEEPVDPKKYLKCKSE
jgi:hypothetical protein